MYFGCTHYPLIQNEIKEVLGDVNFFYGAESLAKHLQDILNKNNLLYEGAGKIEFIDSLSQPKINYSEIEFIDSNNSEKNKERFFEILS